MDATRAAQVLVPVSRIERLTCLSCNTGQCQDKTLLEREGVKELNRGGQKCEGMRNNQRKGEQKH